MYQVDGMQIETEEEWNGRNWLKTYSQLRHEFK